MIEPRYAYGKDLYVGNIEEGTFPEDVIAFLNRAMHTAHLNLWPGNPVLSCRVLPKFCFVSLRHEDEATAALNMDGIYFHGQRLRISGCDAWLPSRPTRRLRRTPDRPSAVAGDLSRRLLGRHVRSGGDRLQVGPEGTGGHPAGDPEHLRGDGRTITDPLSGDHQSRDAS